MRLSIKELFLGILATSLTLLSANAELPAIQEGQGVGNFATSTGKVFQLMISEDASITVNPIRKDGDPTAYLTLRFDFTVRQELPNGKLRSLKVDPASLQSENPATTDLEEAVITGVAGDGATFEMTIEVKRDVLTLGGWITSPGNETKFPLSFHYDVSLGHFRGRLLQRLKGDQEEFEKIVGEDWFELQHLDKKRVKHHLTDQYSDTTDEALNGPGILKAEVQANMIDKNKRILHFDAEGSSKIAFSKRKGKGPFYEGYNLDWTPDQSKAPKDARFVFEIKEK